LEIKILLEEKRQRFYELKARIEEYHSKENQIVSIPTTNNPGKKQTMWRI